MHFWGWHTKKDLCHVLGSGFLRLSKLGKFVHFLPLLLLLSSQREKLVTRREKDKWRDEMEIVQKKNFLQPSQIVFLFFPSSKDLHQTTAVRSVIYARKCKGFNLFPAKRKKPLVLFLSPSLMEKMPDSEEGGRERQK